jgi:hypothetical protein
MYSLYLTATLAILPAIVLAAPRAHGITCPTTPSPFPKAASYDEVATMPDPFLYLDGKSRVQSKEEWFACRQPEIMQMLQEYQYGYYPDHSLETVTATKTGKTLSVVIAVGSTKATIAATINLPTGASASSPAPVIISIGGMDNAAYLAKGIAVVTFDYSAVAADSNSKTGSFWTLYKGRDVGMVPSE